MNDGRLNFKATIDDKDFNRKLSNMEKGVDGLSFDNSTKSLDSLNRKLLETKQRLQENQNELRRLNAQISNTAPGAVKSNLLGERNALSRSINEDKAAVIGYKQEITNLNRELKNTSEGGRTLRSTLSSLTSYFGALIGIGTVVSLLRSFYDTTKQLQTLNKSMELGAKDSLAYASNMAFLKDITEQYGLELLSTSQAYNKFYIGAKEKLALEDIQLIFEKISKSASLMGLSVADQAGIFRALEQMMSKGTVQAEELRGQLGDRLPGAFEIMARSMGVTTAELNKLMQDGEVVASEVLPNFARELEKTFGADKVEMIDNLTSAENRLKNSWTNFVSEVNGSENVIGKVLMGISDGVVSLIDDISRATTSWRRLNQIAGQKGSQEGYNSVMSRADNISQGEAIQNAFRLENDLRRLNKERKDLEKLISSETGLANRDRMKGELENLSGTIGNVSSQLTAYREIARGIKKEDDKTEAKSIKTNDSAIKRAEDLAKRRISFIEQVAKVESDLNQSVLSGRELEMAKISQKYNELIKKAKELGVADGKIKELKTREEEIVTFKSDTENIKTALESDKVLYEQFEEYKKQVGVQKAKEMYADQLDVSKSYYDVLNDEISKIDLNSATDLEKDRYNVLFKLLQDYSINRINKEKETLENLIIETQSYQDRLILIQETYAQKRKDLEKITDESIRNEKLAILKQQEQDATLIIENEIYERNKVERDLIRSLTNYTKRELQSRLRSTQEYLNLYGEFLSDNQKLALQSEADFLKSVIGATDQISRQNTLLKEKERITKAIKENTSKDPEIAKKLNNELADVNNELESNDSLIKDTNHGIQLAVQMANMLTDAFGGTNKELKMAVEAIGNIVSAISKGDMAGAVMAVVGTMIQGAISVFGKDREGERRRDQEKLQLQEEYNKMLRDQLLLESRLNDAHQSRIQAIREEIEMLGGNQESVLNRMKEILSTFYELYKDFGSRGSVLDLDFFLGWQSLGLNEYFENGIELSDELLNKLILLNSEAPLKGTMKDLFDELMRLKEEFGSVNEAVKQLEKELQDRLTGTTAQALGDSIRDGIASGKRSFQDFADDIEGFLRNAILAGMSASVIEPQMQQLQDLLGTFMEDGILTEEERQAFEDKYAQIVEQAGQYLDLINQAGVNIGDDLDMQSAKDGIKRITESQADRLTGILTGMQVDVIASRQILMDSRNLLNSSLDNLIMIEVNTRRTYEGVERIETILQNNQAESLGL